MKNIATCYSEHAIKVTDSYHSGQSSILSRQKSVRCLYRVKLSSDGQFLIRITWSNDHGFSISICKYSCSSSSSNELNKNCRRIEKLKGSISIRGSGLRSEVFWDLTNASYDVGPEPVSGFCILVSINSEIVLFLGDLNRELALQRFGPDSKRISRFAMVSRCEYFSGIGGFSTKAQFSESGTSHDIHIRCTRDSGLSVCVDHRNVIQVKRLQWNFRGNQTIFIDGLLVDMMWDAHDWIFDANSGCAVFMFRTRSGLESRLWLDDNNLEKKENDDDKLGFSFLICACKSSIHS